jgi:hypothetical protein
VQLSGRRHAPSQFLLWTSRAVLTSGYVSLALCSSGLVVVSTLLLALSVSGAASAEDVQSLLARSPEKVLSTRGRSFYDVERCIVETEVPAPAYRTPDRPDYRLFVWRNISASGRIIWDLDVPTAGEVRLRIFEGTRFVGRAEKPCF